MITPCHITMIESQQAMNYMHFLFSHYHIKLLTGSKKLKMSLLLILPKIKFEHTKITVPEIRIRML